MHCRWCNNLDELLIEVSGPARRGLQPSVLFAKYFNSSRFCGLATAMAANVSISEGRDMLKRSLMFLSAAAASFVVTWLVVWFVLVADPHLQPAYATTSSTAVPYKAIASEPFKMVYAANQTTTRILALDQAKRLAFWAFVLKNRKQACDVVVRTMYQGGTESGVDNWSIGCRDSNEYSVSINPDAQDSVCTRKAFARSAE
jgi:hypothetical protein